MTETMTATLATTATTETDVTAIFLDDHPNQQCSEMTESVSPPSTAMIEIVSTASTGENTAVKPPSASNIVRDPEVLAALHYSARIVRASDHSTTHTTRTIVFNARSPIPNTPCRYPDHWHGIYKSYSLKLLHGKQGHDVLRGEYNSMLAINATLNYTNFIPQPIKCGTLFHDPETHFLLSRYHALDSHFLNIDRFVTTLASLHLKSSYQSTAYGFNVSTYSGSYPQVNDRTATWEEYFSTNIRHLLDLEKDIQGPHTPEMHALSNALLSKVIPRLLRPLETFPNAIRPTLLHGDLTPANVATSLYTKAPMVVNPCSFYGHNEYDLRAFVGGRFGVQALETYHRVVPISEPRDDFGDRMRLYGLRGFLQESCEAGGEGGWREKLVEGMRVLVGKYEGGWQAWVEGNGGGRDDEKSGVGLRMG